MSSCFVHPPPSIPKELFHSLRWICSSLLLQVNTELTPAARILHYASIREDSEVCVGVGGGGEGPERASERGLTEVMKYLDDDPDLIIPHPAGP